MYADPAAPVEGERADRFERMVRRRLEHEPLQYILGYAEFYGLRLTVTPAVLIPRPETEELVEAALDLVDGVREPTVLDVGAGSGCIALAIKKIRPDARVFACDVSSAALEVARRNARANDLAVDFVEADLLAAGFTKSVTRGLDLLVSNPPYIAEEEAATLPADVRAYEPHVALFALEDPLAFYRRLAQVGRRLLDGGGWMALETHAEYGADVVRIVEQAGYADVSLRRDLAGRNRIVLARR